MPDFQTVSDQVAILKSWSLHLPSGVADLMRGLDASVEFGERHGTWFLRIIWQQGDLSRAAEVALTNPEATPDTNSSAAIVSVRASASTSGRFVTETLLEKRRTSRTVSTEQFQDWLVTAVQTAVGFNAASLSEDYTTRVADANPS